MHRMFASQSRPKSPFVGLRNGLCWSILRIAITKLTFEGMVKLGMFPEAKSLVFRIINPLVDVMERLGIPISLKHEETLSHSITRLLLLSMGIRMTHSLVLPWRMLCASPLASQTHPLRYLSRKARTPLFLRGFTSWIRVPPGPLKNIISGASTIASNVVLQPFILSDTLILTAGICLA
uniref:Uncharacterized protein n=1 Tax=Palpitomonas bilix TaxID=652834 RepID=A0A7S3G203_9EUKA|mmetsp:Transcript_15456/g.39119  ORF Transcript_15456/g.39119 Transcript_15456/m.39119 type:complete len:179 (+) Transcript_15456:487-1023(+)